MGTIIDLDMLLSLGIENQSVHQSLFDIFKAFELLAGKTKRRHLEVFASQIRRKIKYLDELVDEKQKIDHSLVSVFKEVRGQVIGKIVEYG